MRSSLILTGCAAVLVACSAPATSPAPAGAPVSAVPLSPSASGAAPERIREPGCGDGPVRTGPRLEWASVNAPDGPYVVSAGGDVVGYLFACPLRAGRPTNPSNKILWYVRLPREGNDLVMTGHPRGAAGPVVRHRFPADSSPGEIYPSGVDVPTPGYWTFELAWGEHRDTVDLKYVS
ncbi:hypothetical protein OHA77_36520 [Streptosporangium sp. NBC_01639]|uniref:hypothetical protein n=1 Tax=unclassified Streptosporangium TaxID=2632669 RepID=UPI002DDB7062|nr:hypothetical protein [Streptosporangium sp. NBC_01756]WSC87241.1 hypothetical protein OIE48_03205 [Streptosporangium sp. NBC_01756]WTD54069.1 hypothetical protein OHA77_36520 [Streptosporangium sp. NBC_01639]